MCLCMCVEGGWIVSFLCPVKKGNNVIEHHCVYLFWWFHCFSFSFLFFFIAAYVCSMQWSNYKPNNLAWFTDILHECRRILRRYSRDCFSPCNFCCYCSHHIFFFRLISSPRGKCCIRNNDCNFLKFFCFCCFFLLFFLFRSVQIYSNAHNLLICLISFNLILLYMCIFCCCLELMFFLMVFL